MTLDDIGLIEYSILLVIVALVADSASRSELLTRALALGGIATLLVYGASEVAARTWGDTSTVPVVRIAVGMYMSFYVVWVAARLLHRLPVAPVHLVLAALALVLTGTTQVRSAWVALGLALLAVAVLAPVRARRFLGSAGAVAAVAVVVAGAYGADLAPTLNDPGLDDPQDDALARENPAQRELAGISGSGSTVEAANVRWRLAFWEDQIRGSRDAPLFGAGFGEPAAFKWYGRKSDFRRGFEAYPDNISDVSGPHNGFIDVAYRMGVPALAALIGLIGVALWRLRSLLATGGDRDSERARRVALVGMFASAVVVVGFSDALRGPYLGIFFWTILGLLLVEGRLAVGPDTRPAD
jgi:O-antigen ligase